MFILASLGLQRFLFFLCAAFFIKFCFAFFAHLLLINGLVSCCFLLFFFHCIFFCFVMCLLYAHHPLSTSVIIYLICAPFLLQRIFFHSRVRNRSLPMGVRGKRTYTLKTISFSFCSFYINTNCTVVQLLICFYCSFCCCTLSASRYITYKTLGSNHSLALMYWLMEYKVPIATGEAVFSLQPSSSGLMLPMYGRLTAVVVVS